MIRTRPSAPLVMTVMAALVLASHAGAGGPIFLGPTPYLCVEDSPFELSGLGSTFFIEDFEDGLVNTPGLACTGSPQGPGGITDSVDCDDGVIDGSGQMGRSRFGPGNPGLVMTFSADPFGSFPTAAGVVWTDGSTLNNVTLEAFDAQGASLGTLVGLNIGDGAFNNDTAEDRFFGVFHDGGISKLTIKNQALGGGSGLEIDHVQYGVASVKPACPADLNQDGVVDGADLGLLLSAWAGTGPADLDGSALVDGADLGLMLAAWGPCPQ